VSSPRTVTPGTRSPGARPAEPTAGADAPARPGAGRRDFWERRLLVLGDCLGIVLALAVAPVAAPQGLHLPGSLLMGLLILPVLIAVLKAYGLYDRDAKRVSHATLDDVPWLFHGVLIGTLVLWAYYKVLPGQKLVLAEALVFGAVAFVAVLATRAAMRALAVGILDAERVLLVGQTDMAGLLVRKLRSHPEYALEPVGVLSLGTGDDKAYAGLPVLGRLDDLRDVVVRHRMDRIVVSSEHLDEQEQLEVLRACRELSLKVGLMPQPFDALGPDVEVDEVEGVTLLGVSPPQLARSSRWAKRALDVGGALGGLTLLAPILVAAAVAIKATTRGPVFFRQRRIGKDGNVFRVFKFRTMIVDAEDRVEELRAQSKDPNWLHLDRDPRVTRLGRFLRHTSLDELPQLFNVLRGEMSLVGPRPLIESEDRLINGWGRSRLRLTPGITGYWQVLGRTSIPFDEMVKLDYLYVMNWSLWNDVKLILRTIPVVMQRRGVN
jgi:exopolysaccharide biosynthesis polyprenyl glycosylphosphotransferase